MPDITPQSWTEPLEMFFKETGERAEGLSWIHKKAEQIYSTRRTYIDLPVIIGSGLIAFLNAGSQTLFDDAKLSSISLGIASLFVGLLNTIGTYYGWSKRAEGHRISSISYSRLYRFIKIELGLPRSERCSPTEFMKYVKDAIDRLQEISPLIPPSVEMLYKKRFQKASIAHPEEVNGLNTISVFPALHLSSPQPAGSAGSIQDAATSAVAERQPELRIAVATHTPLSRISEEGAFALSPSALTSSESRGASVSQASATSPPATNAPMTQTESV
jgi:hypothetical protein